MKKFFLFLVSILYFLLFLPNVFSAVLPVHQVFNDIERDYEYGKELQTLYDKGMIFPDENGNFNPSQLLNRDEFVWIASEVSCKRCIQPHTSVDLLNLYKENPFFDVGKENKYFYCIADAKQNSFVSGYTPVIPVLMGLLDNEKHHFVAGILLS